MYTPIHMCHPQTKTRVYANISISHTDGIGGKSEREGGIQGGREICVYMEATIEEYSYREVVRASMYIYKVGGRRINW